MFTAMDYYTMALKLLTASKLDRIQLPLISTPPPISSSPFCHPPQMEYSGNAHTGLLLYAPGLMQSAMPCPDNRTQAMIPMFS